MVTETKDGRRARLCGGITVGPQQLNTAAPQSQDLVQTPAPSLLEGETSPRRWSTGGNVIVKNLHLHLANQKSTNGAELLTQEGGIHQPKSFPTAPKQTRPTKTRFFASAFELRGQTGPHPAGGREGQSCPGKLQSRAASCSLPPSPRQTRSSSDAQQPNAQTSHPN